MFLCDALRDLLLFVQFRKRKNANGEVILLVKLQAEACNFTKSIFPSGCFSRFLNCANDTRLRKAYNLAYGDSYSFLLLRQTSCFNKIIADCRVRGTLFQKQSFANVLQNRWSYKFHKIHRKTPVLETLVIKVAGLKGCNCIKKRL